MDAFDPCQLDYHKPGDGQLGRLSDTHKALLLLCMQALIGKGDAVAARKWHASLGRVERDYVEGLITISKGGIPWRTTYGSDVQPMA